MKRLSNETNQSDARYRLATRRMEEYLNLCQQITGDYKETLKLKTDDPESILQINNDDLRHYAGIIYVCSQSLLLTVQKITYNEAGFKVEVF